MCIYAMMVFLKHLKAYGNVPVGAVFALHIYHIHFFIFSAS